ncbi:MAG: M23 family metallopeptidase [Paenibacillus sp.]|uniref:M23 family metallopeptidase n=1 Tax=Paenibacillus sp. TaxID=58172 RepID=UPI0029150622|nr:M23 family metallopeptidase [Paenibacillus sp.]MDU4698260.1 M23 family metallopeptidase [Paenibacillus sp.]
MKLRFKKNVNRRYTLLIVPEGTSPVFRFKFRFSYLLAILVTAAVLLCSVLVLYALNRTHTNRIGTLEAQLSNSSDQFRNTVVNKEQEIDRLLNELMELSKKSKTIEAKMSELEQLEAELKSITDGGSSKTKDTTAAVDKNAAMDSLASDEGGVGGESIPLTEQDVAQLVKETKESITTSLQEMPELQQRLEQTKVSIQEYKALMAILPTFWPTDSTRITSDFGEREDPFTGRLTKHAGMDIGGSVGDPVYAAANGKVVDTGYTSARGNYITISHPSGLKTNYMHLSKILTKVGDSVKQGDTIAELGSTGRSTGPHLHIEVVKNGSTVDPVNYLRKPGEEE